MIITRVFADQDGESHFEDLEIKLKNSGEIGRLSKNYSVKSIVFRENDADYDYRWHTAPQKQYIILLDGEIELEVSDGEKRFFKGGNIVLVEDVKGKGHRTRSVSDNLRRSIFVTID
jgi:hypothetical protein